MKEFGPEFFFWQNDSCENLDNFSLIWFLYMHRWCLHGPINSYYSFWWNNLILFLYNVDTLNICMKEFIIFVCTDSTEIFFSKLRSAGLNDNLPKFFTDLLFGGYLISIAYWLLSFCLFLSGCFTQVLLYIWALTRETLTLLHANNKDTDQPAHLCSLINTFVIHSLQNM